jgi:hypothetical protein
MTAMPAAPVTAVPATVPAPVAVVPVMPVPVMSPTHLLGRKTLDFGFGCDSGMKVFARGRRTFIFRKRQLRRQRRGLCARGKRSGAGGAGGKSNGEFQKVTAFHDISLSWCMT